MVVEYQKKHPEKKAYKLSQQDIESIQTVASYLSDHYASDTPLERLTQIACILLPADLQNFLGKALDCFPLNTVKQRNSIKRSKQDGALYSKYTDSSAEYRPELYEPDDLQV